MCKSSVLLATSMLAEHSAALDSNNEIHFRQRCGAWGENPGFEHLDFKPPMRLSRSGKTIIYRSVPTDAEIRELDRTT